ncbi:DNA polymerase lambda isoform X2 [Etheostoma cragini]|uniref:DNA polymerase lambda isoform X2 n=1 Tax=Etheostoma cragini TaxID=417921 RepID=UPI00155E84D1|nr:DNA polymerase lambda isoform X2 [Etheostoma cragini]
MEPRHGIVKAFPKVKRAKVLPGKDAPPAKKKLEECGVPGSIFNGVSVYILPAGIGTARCQIFQRQIQQNGGQTESSLCPSVTHVVVDDNMNRDRALRLLKVQCMPSGVQLVKCIWLSLCISEKQLLEVDSYSLISPKRESETKHDNIKEEVLNVKPAEEAIAEPVSDQARQEETIDMEACQIPGIGKRMADKIDEIMESGHLRKLDHLGEAVPVLELFTNIWGAGVKTAQLWYQQGFRTLEDIRTKAHLSNTQKIGLKHYDDFLDRMPREEAAAIEKVVRDAVQAIDPGLLAIACGSYRREKATCGDVDILISHPDGKSHKGVFSKVLQSLHDSGFLTDDLVSHEENGEQKKYMGVCHLPGPGHRHRRLDIIVVPYNEFACALMYFTGSAHFNRSMRALAKTKKMSLSEHSLNKDVVRHGSLKVYNGTSFATPTEKDVFSLLGIPYRQPHERDW